MGALEFIAAIVKALVWPTTAMGAILIFRHPLGKLIASLRRHKSIIGEFDFDQKLEVAEESDATLPPLVPSSISIEKELPDGLNNKLSPEEKVIHNWSPVGKAIWELAEARGMPSCSHSVSNLRNIRWLEDQGIINTPTTRLLRNLKKMRDAVKNGELMSVSPEQASRFSELAASAVARLQTLKTQTKTAVGSPGDGLVTAPRAR